MFYIFEEIIEEWKTQFPSHRQHASIQHMNVQMKQWCIFFHILPVVIKYVVKLRTISVYHNLDITNHLKVIAKNKNLNDLCEEHS